MTLWEMSHFSIAAQELSCPAKEAGYTYKYGTRNVDTVNKWLRYMAIKQREDREDRGLCKEREEKKREGRREPCLSD